MIGRSLTLTPSRAVAHDNGRTPKPTTATRMAHAAARAYHGLHERHEGLPRPPRGARVDLRLRVHGIRAAHQRRRRRATDDAGAGADTGTGRLAVHRIPGHLHGVPDPGRARRTVAGRAP